MSKSLNQLLYDAVAALAMAGDNHAAAVRRTSEARSAECTALNAVHEAQREFDRLTALVKSEAPRGSDWKRNPGLPA